MDEIEKAQKNLNDKYVAAYEKNKRIMEEVDNAAKNSKAVDAAANSWSAIQRFNNLQEKNRAQHGTEVTSKNSVEQKTPQAALEALGITSTDKKEIYSKLKALTDKDNTSLSQELLENAMIVSQGMLGPEYAGFTLDIATNLSSNYPDSKPQIVVSLAKTMQDLTQMIDYINAPMDFDSNFMSDINIAKYKLREPIYTEIDGKQEFVGLGSSPLQKMLHNRERIEDFIKRLDKTVDKSDFKDIAESSISEKSIVSQSLKNAVQELENPINNRTEEK